AKTEGAFEEKAWLSRVERGRKFHIHPHERVALSVEELFAVGIPMRSASSIGRHHPPSAAAIGRHHVHVVLSGGVGVVRQPASVRGKHSTSFSGCCYQERFHLRGRILRKELDIATSGMRLVNARDELYC